MIETVEAAKGGYRFMPGVSQYSAGVAALPGFTLERVRFTKPVPMRQGFDRIAQILKDAGRPLTAFAACELRSPAPFTESGFVKFNEVYTGTLKAWGLLSGWGKSCRAQQRVSEDRSAGGTELPCVYVCRAGSKCADVVRRRGQR